MRTTVDIADNLLRRAKTEAALRGISFKDLVEEALLRVLDSPDPRESSAEQVTSPTLYQLMKRYCGIVDSGISDLASNAKHREG